MQLKQYLESVTAELSARLAAVDASCVSGSDAAEVVEALSLIERQVGAARVGYARRAVSANGHVSSGARDGAAWLALASGSSVGEAKADLEAASQMESLTLVSDAFHSGDISTDQAREIAAAATLDPAAEASLLELAGSSSLAGLKKACRDVRAKSCSDELSRYEEIHRRRFLRTWVDRDGSVCGQFRLAPLEGALVLGRLEPFIDSAFCDGRRSGSFESRDAYCADGLVALAGSGGIGKASRPLRAEVVVLVDHEALVRGYGQSSEHCEIEGLGSVPVALVESLMQNCHLSVIVKRDNKPAGLPTLWLTPDL